MDVKTLSTEAAATHDNDDQRQRNAAARRLLQTWLADESGYDEETWPVLKEAFEATRIASGPYRKLFRD